VVPGPVTFVGTFGFGRVGAVGFLVVRVGCV
jgi:hypothetical protein